MRLAFISDIHGNLKALEKALKIIKADEIYCLGDVVGYGANPAECCNAVKKYCSAGTILGNHDAAIIQGYAQSLETSFLKRRGEPFVPVGI